MRRAAAYQEGVAVRIRARHGSGTDVAPGTGSVFNDDRLPSALPSLSPTSRAMISAATAITLMLGLLAKFKGEDDARIRWRRRASVGTVAAAAAGTVSTVGFG